ncbi:MULTISPECIES: hypothetical protein [Aestuariibaculum]|uniref:PepSY domain-containing protein n=1 Tax=Aestuariibaculum lutulentum TaxID=2920935 RepID=A0ABS9RGF2_9FLAO|nr:MULTISPECIES: hypothetical protein [Aestuariibaculum]MCH4552020.1 hypothetical protein [Aestuariibaculum lutulentum]MCR8667113.1 hypothetical protein [Aestuariibaculum sp. M13]
MKKILLFTGMLLLTANVKAVELNLNLNNPDVRQCLIDSASKDGWELKAKYLDDNDKVVLVFKKEGQVVEYTGNQKLEY